MLIDFESHTGDTLCSVEVDSATATAASGLVADEATPEDRCIVQLEPYHDEGLPTERLVCALFSLHPTSDWDDYRRVQRELILLREDYNLGCDQLQNQYESMDQERVSRFKEQLAANVQSVYQRMREGEVDMASEGVQTRLQDILHKLTVSAEDELQAERQQALTEHDEYMETLTGEYNVQSIRLARQLLEFEETFSYLAFLRDEASVMGLLELSVILECSAICSCLLEHISLQFDLYSSREEWSHETFRRSPECLKLLLSMVPQSLLDSECPLFDEIDDDGESSSAESAESVTANGDGPAPQTPVQAKPSSAPPKSSGRAKLTITQLHLRQVEEARAVSLQALLSIPEDVHSRVKTTTSTKTSDVLRYLTAEDDLTATAASRHIGAYTMLAHTLALSSQPAPHMPIFEHGSQKAGSMVKKIRTRGKQESGVTKPPVQHNNATPTKGRVSMSMGGKTDHIVKQQLMLHIAQYRKSTGTARSSTSTATSAALSSRTQRRVNSLRSSQGRREYGQPAGTRSGAAGTSPAGSDRGSQPVSRQSSATSLSSSQQPKKGGKANRSGGGDDDAFIKDDSDSDDPAKQRAEAARRARARAYQREQEEKAREEAEQAAMLEAAKEAEERAAEAERAQSSARGRDKGTAAAGADDAGKDADGEDADSSPSDANDDKKDDSDKPVPESKKEAAPEPATTTTTTTTTATTSDNDTGAASPSIAIQPEPASTTMADTGDAASGEPKTAMEKILERRRRRAQLQEQEMEV